jgi:predicted DNA-binding transcriptional regulator AlpA
MDIPSGIDELVKLQRETLARLTVGPAELLDVIAVGSLLGIAENTVWALARGGDFPQPIDLGIKKTMWRRTEVLEWIKRRKPKRKKPKRVSP